MKTIEKGINLVNNNGTVYLANGTITKESTSQFTISKTINVIGQTGTIIDCNNKQMFQIAANQKVTFKNMTIINAYTTGFGGVFDNRGDLTVSDILFANNTAQGGAAIDNAQYLTVINCVFDNNSATRDGGALSQSAQNTDTMTVINSTFTNNKGGRNGGAIKYQGSDIPLLIKDSTFINNKIGTTDNWGGAIYVWNSNADIATSTFINNTAQDGGAVYAGGKYAKTLDITQCLFENNTASRNGEAVYYDYNSYDRFNLTYSAIINNNIKYFNNVKSINININNNWWGTNEVNFTERTGNDKANITKWAVLNLTANPDKIPCGDSSIITGSFIWNDNTNENINLLPDRILEFSSTGGRFEENEVVLDENATGKFIASTPVGTYVITGTVDNEKINLNITVTALNANLTVPDVTVSANEKATVTAILTDSEGNPLAGEEIIVNINGWEIKTVTAQNGIATVDVPFAVGQYLVNVTYKGNDFYSEENKIANLTITEVITNKADINIISIEGTKITGALKDSNGNAISNATVSYTIGNETVNLTTDANGEFIIPAEIGKEVVINYAGSDSIKGANTSFTIKDRIATAFESEAYKTIAIDFYARERGNYFVFTLKDINGNPLANKSVFIGFNGVTYNRTTDENGTALLQINLMNAGTYTFAMGFLGDENYLGAFMVQKITVTQKKTSITAAAKSYKASATKKYTVTLKTNKGNSIDGKTYLKSGKTIKLTVNGKTYAAKTNAKGQATFNIKLTKKGTYTAKIKFAGDKTYKASSKSVKITIK